MMRVPVCLAVCLLLPALAALAMANETEPPWNGVRNLFRSRLASKDPKQKERAFECLRGRAEAEAFEELLRGYKKVRAEGDQIRVRQEMAERSYERSLKKLYGAKERFDLGRRGAKDIERFNKTERQLSAQIDEARRTAKKLENEWARNRALLDSSTTVASSMLAAMPVQRARETLAQLRGVWLEGRDPEGPMRWLDTLASAPSAAVTDELLRVLGDESIPKPARVAAVEALAECGVREALDKATAMLMLPPDEFQLVTAAIGAIRKLHDKRGITPLIEFLARKDLGRLREDARDTLVSLTAQEHGPYSEPWHDWWAKNEESFEMPASPYSAPPMVGENKSKTFYGIHTFSERVLYIVDFSESMNWAPGKRGVPGGDDAKVARLREELIGAVNGLEPGSNFNVIVFNHEVMSWSGKGVVTATETSKRKLARWIGEMTPIGLTNIYDALEAGFRLILGTTGRPPYDTIFFLTDGKPTGGKITDPELILDSVRDWNSVANVRIHVVGIGHGKDVDQHFLQQLAEIGGGKYIQRNR